VAKRPNVLVMLFDDLGFAQLGCFGADFDTPHIDRLAAEGLRYNRFHVTAVCSASRAALLTGRNHHAVGVGNLVGTNVGTFPGYTGRIPRTAGTMPRILRDAGYNTWAVGKWHLTPQSDETCAGPFDLWPLGLGFERFYGHVRGEANQWTPNLVCDNHYIDPPRRPEDGYHVTEDLADQAIRLIVDQKHAAPDKPFFLYFATGATHSPHHVPRPWIERYRGRFDIGWDAWREEVFRRQLASGVVPEGTVLTERPSWVRAWDDLSEDERRLFCRMHEVYAGFVSHTDAQLGRVLACLEAIGELDNTIVIVTSDNGASAEGGPIGTHNEHRFTQRLPDTVEDNLRYFDDWGGFRSTYHYAWGWAWAGNTPFRLWKRYTWLGGTRVPMILRWPAGFGAVGEIRSQFAHLVDVMPTILECCGVDVPETIDGHAQQRVDGASIVPTFHDANAPSPRTVQYFELWGSRSIVSGDWKATTDHVMGIVDDEEELLEGSRAFRDDRWNLFRLDEDFSEANDLSDRYPEVVDELRELWYVEAGRNNVMPLGDTIAATMQSFTRPDVSASERTYRPGGSPIGVTSLPAMAAGVDLTATIDVPIDASGVIFALGDWNNGFALYVKDKTLCGVFNNGGDATIVRASTPLPPGRTEVTLSFALRNPEPGTEVTVSRNGHAVASGQAAHRIPGHWQHGGTALCIGYDRGFPVCDDYGPPFPWTGTIESVRIRTAEQPDNTVVARNDLRAAVHSD
jgi:arylsulfatase A-like enzyme